MGGMVSMYSPTSGERIFQPCRIWRLRSSALYWVRMKIRRMWELRQFDSVKSIIRYPPPNETAGFGVLWVEEREGPSPPPPRQKSQKIIHFCDCDLLTNHQ